MEKVKNICKNCKTSVWAYNPKPFNNSANFTINDYNYINTFSVDICNNCLYCSENIFTQTLSNEISEFIASADYKSLLQNNEIINIAMQIENVISYNYITSSDFGKFDCASTIYRLKKDYKLAMLCAYKSIENKMQAQKKYMHYYEENYDGEPDELYSNILDLISLLKISIQQTLTEIKGLYQLTLAQDFETVIVYLSVCMAESKKLAKPFAKLIEKSKTIDTEVKTKLI